MASPEYHGIPYSRKVWKILNQYNYIDKTLPFGLCSAPKIFLAITDAIQWIWIKKELETSFITWMSMYIATSCERKG